MPYVGLPYSILRLFTENTDLIFSIISILQVLIGSTSIVYYAKLGEELYANLRNARSSSKWLFRSYIFLSLLSLHTLHFDTAMLSDSLGTSFLSIFCYYYYKYLTQGRPRRMLLLTGLFLGLATLWRPYFSALYILLILEGMAYYYFNKRESIRWLPKHILIIISPLIILDLPWIVRNMIVFERFIPFQIDLYAGMYPKSLIAFMDFARIYGGSWNYSTNPRKFGCYFHDMSGCTFILPSYSLGEKLNIGTIQKAKKLYSAYRADTNDKLLEGVLIYTFMKMKRYYHEDHPYTSHIIPRLIAIREYLFHGGTWFFPSFERGTECFPAVIFYALKITQSLLYWFALIGGLVGLTLLVVHRRETFIFISIPLFLIALFPIFFIAEESRYFYGAYPQLLLGAVIFLFHLLDKVGRKLVIRS